MPASRPGKFRLKQRLIARQIERRPERQLIRRLRDPLDLHHQNRSWRTWLASSCSLMPLCRAQREAEQAQGRQLGGEGLGRGHADFGPARVISTMSASRTSEDSGTLQIAAVAR